MTVLAGLRAALYRACQPSRLGLSDEAAARVKDRMNNAAIALASLDNAVLATKSGDVDWSYIEHELTTVRLRWPSFTEYDETVREIRDLFRQGPVPT